MSTDAEGFRSASEVYQAAREAAGLPPEEAPNRSPKPNGGGTTGRASTYGERALERAIANLVRAPRGERNTTLASEAYSIGQLVPAHVPESVALDALWDAVAGWDKTAEGITKKTLERQFAEGMKKPRTPEDRYDVPPAPRQDSEEHDYPADAFDDYLPTDAADAANDPSYQTDLGNAERFVGQHGDDVRYCPGLGWLVNDGRRYARDEGGDVVRRGKKTIRSIYREAASARDGGEAKELAKWATRSEAADRISAMIKLATTEARVAITSGDLDRDPMLLNVANGTIALHTGTLRPHSRADLLTKLAPVDFDPKATCPTFDRFLAEAQPDPEVRAYLQRHAGYALTGLIREHVLPIHYGGGANGKTTFVNAMLRMLGDYAITVSPELLMEQRGDRHPCDRMTLFGRRWAAAEETDEGRALNVALVKQLTGGNEISARYMRENPVTFWPTHKLVMVTNHRPVIRETKDSIWRRVQLIPWSVSFQGREDRELPEKLDAERPGILAWAVRGCLEWQRIGLAPPPSLVAASEGYRAEQDMLGDFFAQCVFGADQRVPRAELRRAYEGWCRETGSHPLGAARFTERLRERGVVDGGTMRTAYSSTPVNAWKGVRLRTENDPCSQ